MSTRYQAALSRAGINTAGPQLYWQLRSNNARRCRILEIGVSVSVAPSTAPSFAISRATTSLGTASTSQAGLALDPGDVGGTGILESAWSGAPTIATTYHRSFALAVTAGGGFIWSFMPDRPLVLAPDSALQIVNLNASGATTGTFLSYVLWDE